MVDHVGHVDSLRLASAHDDRGRARQEPAAHNADRARVVLTYDADSIRLAISDDGVGFDGPMDPTELMQSGRLGLMGIYERARLFGGKATITSEPGNGTTIVITIPLTAILMPSEPHAP